MKSKKILSVIIAAVFAAGTFGACGQTESPDSSSSVSSSASSSSSSVSSSSDTSSDSSSGSGSGNAYLMAATDIIDSAEEICDAGYETADLLRTAAADLMMLVENPEAITETSITTDDEYVDFTVKTYESVRPKRDDIKELIAKLDSVTVTGDDLLVSIKQDLEDTLTDMDGTFADMEALVNFYKEFKAGYNEMLVPVTEDASQYADSSEYLNAVATALTELKTAYKEMDRPEQLAEIYDEYTDNIDMFSASLMYVSNFTASNGATIYNYIFNHMNAYNSVVEAGYTKQLIAVTGASYEWDSSMFGETYKNKLEDLRNCCKNSTEYSEPEPSNEFAYDVTDEIYPNRYPTMDSAVNLTAASSGKSQDIIISAEIVGFTQPYEQKVTLTEQVRYFKIKPPLLPELPDLSTRRDTQLTFKITDNDTGKVLVQESKDIVLYSIYDFFIETDEFGKASIFDLLGWLRPESDAIDAVNRQAISYLESMTGTGMLTGYTPSYSENPDVNTLVQVAAIQKAISDLGMRYTMDPYSFSGAQHILTPDQVVAKKTGLCIESSLLMASCLMKANLHPIIILTPGHAQVAVESYVGAEGSSGIYYLVETTSVPYNGFTVTDNGVDFGGLILNVSDPSSAWWDNYLASNITEDGFPYVIDCDLRSVLKIQGLENVQASVDIEPVEYDSTEIPQVTEGTDGGSGTDDGGSGSGSEDSDYAFATNESNDLTIAVKTNYEVTSDGSLIIVHPIAGQSSPVMYATRASDTDVNTYFNTWIESLKSDNTVVELPSEIGSSEFGTLTYSFISYYTTSDNSTYYQNFVAAVTLDDGSLAVFELIGKDGDNDGIDALNEAFSVALYTFMI